MANLVNVKIDNEHPQVWMCALECSKCQEDVGVNAPPTTLVGACMMHAAAQVDCKPVFHCKLRSNHRSTNGIQRWYQDAALSHRVWEKSQRKKLANGSHGCRAFKGVEILRSVYILGREHASDFLPKAQSVLPVATDRRMHLLSKEGSPTNAQKFSCIYSYQTSAASLVQKM
jgi:hypothetical protein